MAQFYYDKYSVNNKTYYKEGAWSFFKSTMTFYKNKNALTLNERGVNFNQNNGYVIPLANYWSTWGTLGGSAPVYLTASIIDNYAQTVYRCSSASGDTSFVGSNVYIKTCTPYTERNRGSLVSSNIVADENVYPINGIHTDGFWYVRKAEVPQPVEHFYYDKYNIAKGGLVNTGIVGTQEDYPADGPKGDFWYVRTGTAN